MAKARVDIDREQVRMLVLEFGVREAARKVGVNENTVKTWCRDGGWLAQFTRPKITPEPPASMRLIKPIPPNSPDHAKCTILGEKEPNVAKSPAEILTEALLEDSYCTRSAASRLLRRSLERAESVDIASAGDALSAVKAASILHKWESDDKQAPVVNLNVLTQVNLNDYI